MLFKKKGIIYFSRKEVKIYSHGVVEPIVLSLNKDLFANLESVDALILTQQFDDIEKTKDKKFSVKNHKFIVVLADDLVFSKTLKNDEETIKNKYKTVQNFIDQIPLNPENIKVKECISGNNLLLTATNHLIYETLINVLEKYKSSVHMITSQVFLENIEVKSELIDNFFKNIELYRYRNYLYDYTPKSKLQKILEASGYLTLFVVAIYGIYTFLDKNPWFIPLVWERKNSFLTWLVNNIIHLYKVVSAFLVQLFRSISESLSYFFGNLGENSLLFFNNLIRWFSNFGVLFSANLSYYFEAFIKGLQDFWSTLSTNSTYLFISLVKNVQDIWIIVSTYLYNFLSIIGNWTVNSFDFLISQLNFLYQE